MIINAPAIHASLFDGQTIGAVQKQFSDQYPFLKIDFFKELELNGIRVIKKLEPHYMLYRLSASNIDIAGSRSVADTKKEFKSVTGLLTRVYRRAGEVWIETSLTDDWSLDRQNSEGRQIG
ncbi:MAG: hypothetical protein ACKOYP_00595 [Bacteroidota bacterium]